MATKEGTVPKKKKKLPVDLDAEFVERVKDCVVFMQRGPEPMTSIRSLVEDALRAKLRAVRRKYRDLLPEDGEIPARMEVRPRPGRPLS